MDLPKAYEPKITEDKIYELWQKSGFFNPDKLPGKRKKPYTIVIPPPNVTGELHMGHALNATIQDILIRKKRMQGFKTLWLPGTDHAGIATQNVVEKKLKKEGLNRFDLGRDKFIEEVWKWKEKYGDIILNQFKKMGCSCDWSRARFTMDENYSKTIKEVFLHYYNKSWIYRGKKPVNWCPRCGTSLSDLELEYKEEQGNLCYIKYQISPKQNRFATGQIKIKNNYIIVATTRPETMLGDTAVAINPKDERYKNLIGEKVILPLTGRRIPVVADKIVDIEFGTGAVKVTPAHDLQDYEIGLKHKLPLIQIIGERGEITKEAPLSYQGFKVLDARAKILEELKNQGLLEKIEPYSHQVPKCYRCGSSVEIILSLQWFLKMGELAKMAQDPVKKGKIKFHPKSFEKPYFNWLKNIKDWCISRQIWWGHKIPLEGENDVLDTWFSSALWPFAALGWDGVKNKKSKNDLDKFYPTDVLSTARDIINLWVARMIFSGMEFMKKIPFKDVYIHATVLTKDGKKMSKSLGTGINPLDLVGEFGADATRFGIAYQITGGQDIKFSTDNVLMGKKFCNKLWNASRFILMNKPSLIYPVRGYKDKKKPQGKQTSNGVYADDSGFARMKNLTAADKKILKALEKTIKSVNSDLDNFKFGKAAHILYNFFWHDFCDVYIEISKKQQDEKTKKILFYVLLNSLKLLHPFMPFITEEIYQKLPIKNKKELLMIEEWPI